MDLLLVGGGPRSIIQANAELAFLCLYEDHFQHLASLGADYHISTTIIEKQPRLGAGMAFGTGHVGMTNTPVEDDIHFPFPIENENGFKKDVLSLLSYEKRYEKRFGGVNAEDYFHTLESLNLPGAVMFQRSLSAMSYTSRGFLDQSKAFLMRRSVGEEEVDTFAKMQAAALKIPFYHLNIQSQSLVKEVRVMGTEKSVVLMEDSKTGAKREIEADMVRLNSGTTVRNPITNPLVKQLTYCAPMNAKDLRLFFVGKEMLDSNGMLLQGKRIISGGLSLSGLDQIAALSTIMNLFEVADDSLLGYRVTEEAKIKYQGAITFINRTDGKTAVPRHSFQHHWQQGTPVIGKSEHLHALFLHEHCEGVFKIWYDIIECAVARAVESTPREIEERRCTVETLEFLFEETKWHLSCREKAGKCEMNGDMDGKEKFLELSTRTLPGAWRQACLSLILGFGLENSHEDAVKRMEKLAPITWKGRQGYLMHRAQIAAITAPEETSKKSNLESVKRLDDIMKNIVASPSEIHSMFHILLEAGIARYVQAPYSAITKDSHINKLKLRDEEYDALIVSAVMTKDTDKTIESLLGQVASVEGSNGMVPKVGAFRRLSSKNGDLLPVESNTLVGKGFMKEAEDGGMSLVASCAFDVNNRESAVADSSGFALRRMALAHLSAAGLNGSDELDEIYNSLKAEEEEYNKEVESFKEYYQEAVEIWCYLRAISKFCATNGTLFRHLYDMGATSKGRSNVLKMISENGNTNMQKLCVEFWNLLHQQPVYSPVSRDGFYERFVDATEDMNAKAYEKAREVAEKHLSS